jgi:hypothetical protein
MSNQKVILVGYWGHAYTVAETALENDFEDIGYSDKGKSDLCCNLY